ncbi:MAG: hypothetical protein JWM34_396 [Ilumatobacteraceae bacterium]|nr:hypothetical protein [Ilumatobacteraceae bacterium]
MRWVSQLRMLIARRPWIHWSIVVVLALLVCWSVAAALAGVRREQSAWGRSREVYMTTRAVSAGEPIAAAARRREVPLALVPASALDTLAPTDAATHALGAGEIVVHTDIAAEGGPTALLPVGWLAVDVADVPNATLFAIGDAAAVLADGRTIAAHAVIVAVTATDVVVGVPDADAPAVAAAANDRSAVVALDRSG